MSSSSSNPPKPEAPAQWGVKYYKLEETNEYQRVRASAAITAMSAIIRAQCNPDAIRLNGFAPSVEEVAAESICYADALMGKLNMKVNGESFAAAVTLATDPKSEVKP